MSPVGTRDTSPHRRLVRAGSLLLALAVVLSTALQLIQSRTPASAFPSSLLPSSGAYFGSWVKPRNGESVQDALLRVERQIGRKFAIDHQYYSWNQAIPTRHQDWDVANGRIPFVNWSAAGGNNVRWSSIANGSQDAWIRERANAFRAFGAPIYLTFHHEPEDDLSRFGSAADFAAAFRRIVTVFRAQGVTNVAFVWTMMSWTFDARSGRSPSSFYPGDGYVDFVGSDGYSWYPGRRGDQWAEFSKIFQPTNDFAAAHRKPWMAVEYGVQEDPSQSGRKGQWFRNAAMAAKSWPTLKALIYFDEHKAYNWVTDSSSSSMSGYRALATDAYLRPGSGPPSSPPPSTPPPTQTPTPTPTPPPGSGLQFNRLDVGPSGAAVLAGQRSTSGESALGAVRVSNGASLTYDRTHSRGAYAAKHVLLSGDDAYYEWGGTRSTWFGHVYLWMGSPPSEALRLIRATSSGWFKLAIDVLTNGTLRVVDQQGRTILSSRRAIATGQWVRIEWKVDHGRGSVELRLFNSTSSSTPTDVVTSGSGNMIGSSVNAVQFGRTGQQSFAVTFWTDDPALSSASYPPA